MFGQHELLWMRVVGWGTLNEHHVRVLDAAHPGVAGRVDSPSPPCRTLLMRKVATLGYGVYLVHLPMCEYLIAPVAKRLVEHHAWPMTVVWPISVAALFSLSLATSYALHLIVDKPAAPASATA